MHCLAASFTHDNVQTHKQQAMACKVNAAHARLVRCTNYLRSCPNFQLRAYNAPSLQLATYSPATVFENPWIIECQIIKKHLHQKENRQKYLTKNLQFAEKGIRRNSVQQSSKVRSYPRTLLAIVFESRWRVFVHVQARLRSMSFENCFVR